MARENEKHETKGNAMIMLVTPDGKRYLECVGFTCPAADMAECIAWWSQFSDEPLSAMYMD